MGSSGIAVFLLGVITGILITIGILELQTRIFIWKNSK